MSKDANKKKLFALALRLQKKFGVKATQGIMQRLTSGDQMAVELLSRHRFSGLERRGAGVHRDFEMEDELRERERKMTKRGRKSR